MCEIPEFIPASIWERKFKPSQLVKYFVIDRNNPIGFITAKSKTNNKIPFEEVKSDSYSHDTCKVYSVKDVVESALIDGLLVEPPLAGEHSYTSLKGVIKNCEKEIEELNSNIAELRRKRDMLDAECALGDILSEMPGYIDKPLPSFDVIVENSSEVVSGTGVYFLIDENQIVYVGQSVNIGSRITTHIANDEKRFDKFAYICCDKAHLDVVESLYIHMYRPKYNGKGSDACMKNNPDYIFAPISQKNLYSLLVDDIKN